MITKGDKILIENLWESKGYGAQRSKVTITHVLPPFLWFTV